MARWFQVPDLPVALMPVKRRHRPPRQPSAPLRELWRGPDACQRCVGRLGDRAVGVMKQF
jgi:hypothetical protein